MQMIWSVAVHFCSLISESNNRKCIIHMLPIYTYVESYLSHKKCGLVFEHETFCEFGSNCALHELNPRLCFKWVLYLHQRSLTMMVRGAAQKCTFIPTKRIELWGQTNAPKVSKCPNKGTPNERIIGFVYTTGQTFGIIMIWKKSLILTNTYTQLHLFE